jgi:Ribbon-helix-helix protein, copG family
VLVHRQRATFSLDPALLRAVRVMAARTGRRDSDIVEAALRRFLTIGVLESIWRDAPDDLDADAGLALARDEQHAARRG